MLYLFALIYVFPYSNTGEKGGYQSLFNKINFVKKS